MSYENYKLIRIEIRGKIAYATINNPPVNLITRPLLEEFTRLRPSSKRMMTYWS